MIRNQVLYQKTHELAANVLNAYKQFMAEGGWRDIIYGKEPYMIFLEVFRSAGSRDTDWIRKNRPSLKPFISCVDVFESCVDYILKDTTLDEINDFSSKLAINPNFACLIREMLIDLLCRLIEEIRERPPWLDEMFVSFLDVPYKRLENFLYAKTQSFRFLLPIVNFHLEETLFKLEIGHNMRVIDILERRIEMERVPDVFRRVLIFQPIMPEVNGLEISCETEKFGNLGAPGNRFVLTKDQVYAFNVGSNIVSGPGIGFGGVNVSDIPIEVIKSACNFMTALRLLKSGNIGYSAIYIQKPDGILRSIAVDPPPLTLPIREPSGDRYVLGTNELEKAKQLFLSLSRMDASTDLQKTIRLAIDRFDYSYQKVSPEDRLIDYIIALEALLLEGDAELRYRLALRTSVLLGKHDEKKAIEIFQFTKSAYDLRSALVHGGNVSETLRKMDIGLEESVLKLEDYTREAISEVLIKHRKHRTKKEILKILDEKILKPSLRT